MKKFNVKQPSPQTFIRRLIKEIEAEQKKHERASSSGKYSSSCSTCCERMGRIDALKQALEAFKKRPKKILSAL